MAGAQYGAPERFAAILGFAVANGGMGEPRAGYAVVADGGQGGARASLAVFSRAPTGVGAQVRVSAIRTWRNPLVVAANQTFVGPELRISFTALTVGVGHYWRTAGTTPGDNRFAAVTFSVEF